jgi:hypothetical protein
MNTKQKRPARKMPLSNDYLSKRAKRASKQKFRKALSKVANVPPADRDRS